jgi:hypothetical protein
LRVKTRKKMTKSWIARMVISKLWVFPLKIDETLHVSMQWLIQFLSHFVKKRRNTSRLHYSNSSRKWASTLQYAHALLILLFTATKWSRSRRSHRSNEHEPKKPTSHATTLQQHERISSLSSNSRRPIRWRIFPRRLTSLLTDAAHRKCEETRSTPKNRTLFRSRMI